LRVGTPNNRIGAIDEPTSNRSVPGFQFVVRGWSLLRATRIEVYANGELIGPARLGCPRQDIALVSRLPRAPASGFETILDLEGLVEPGTEVEITAIVEADGRRTMIGATSVQVPSVTSDWAPLSTSPSRTRVSRRGPKSLVAVSHALSLGGAEFFLLRLLAGLEATGFRCSVIALQDGPLRPALEASVRGDIRVAGEPNYSEPGDYLKDLSRFAELVDSEGADVVLVNGLQAFAGADVATTLALPCVWAIHESLSPRSFWAFGFPNGGLDRWVRTRAELALREVDAVTFVSNATRALFEKHVLPTRMHTIRYGIDLDSACRDPAKAAETRRKLGLPTDSLVLCSVGTLEPRKGQTLLIEAIAALRARYPSVRLILVGDTGSPYAQVCHELVRRHRLQELVTIVRATPDTATYYNASDAFVGASDNESMPRSMMEAMAHGLPVIAPRVFGVPELVPWNGGLLFPERDFGALVEALESVLATPSELCRMGAAALAHVRGHHDARSYVEDYATLLREITSPCSGSVPACVSS
jgi:glycosyltransferase involved in cell wall biosynthesis